jgi:hypothetical protein
MKYLLVSIISLLVFVIANAETIKNCITALAERFDMPELYYISDEQELYWFANREHITEPIFFYNSLMSEMSNSESFSQSRQLIAKYGLRKYLSMSESDQALVNSLYRLTSINILLRSDNFPALFELAIQFGSKMITLLDAVSISSMKPLAEALLVYPEKQTFMDAIGRHEVVAPFSAHLFSQLILLEAPESFYIGYLEANANLCLAATTIVIEEYEMRNPVDIDGINRAVRIFVNAIRDTERFGSFLNFLNEEIRVISSPDTVTLAELGIDVTGYDFERKKDFIINAGTHRKDLVLREVLQTLSVEETITFVSMMFSSSNEIKKIGLKLGVKIYNVLPESIRGFLHESESYLQAAAQWLRLDSIEELVHERLYSHKIVFKADSQQIADGLFEEMVYYHRRDRAYSDSNYAFNLRFTSAESFANFISKDVRHIFPQLSETTLFTSKDTLKLLAANEDSRILLAQRDLKILVDLPDIMSFIRESSIENIPKMGNLIRHDFFTIDILSAIENPCSFSKIEKFSSKSIVEIVNQRLRVMTRPVSQVEYFKIRNALVYLINSPNRFRLNELPDPIKAFIAQEFPRLAGEL